MCPFHIGFSDLTVAIKVTHGLSVFVANSVEIDRDRGRQILGIKPVALLMLGLIVILMSLYIDSLIFILRHGSQVAHADLDLSL